MADRLASCCCCAGGTVVAWTIQGFLIGSPLCRPDWHAFRASRHRPGPAGRRDPGRGSADRERPGQVAVRQEVEPTMVSLTNDEGSKEILTYVLAPVGAGDD